MFFDAYLLMKMRVCFKKKMIEEEWQWRLKKKEMSNDGQRPAVKTEEDGIANDGQHSTVKEKGFWNLGFSNIFFKQYKPGFLKTFKKIWKYF